MNFFEDLDAPPIKNPSNGLMFLNFDIFELSTEPPYNRGGIFFDLKNVFNIFLILVDILKSSFPLGINPEPIDQIGS